MVVVVAAVVVHSLSCLEILLLIAERPNSEFFMAMGALVAVIFVHRRIIQSGHSKQESKDDKHNRNIFWYAIEVERCASCSKENHTTCPLNRASLPLNVSDTFVATCVALHRDRESSPFKFCLIVLTILQKWLNVHRLAHWLTVQRLGVVQRGIHFRF